MKKIINPWKGLDGYMCFGCAPENPQGLHMEFYEDGEDIVAFWEPESHYQGWLETLHGGIQTTMMDELAGWVVLRKLQTSGVTSRLDARFLKSISTREPRLMIRGRIKEQLCSRADIVYFVVTKEQATEKFHFAGCKTEDEK